VPDVPEVRILLVEDDEEDALIFCRYVGRVTDSVIRVVHVTSGAEAKERIGRETFDMMFLDLNLGGGTSGMDMLRELHDEHSDLPVVVVTGSGDEVRAVEAMKAGAYDYLVKDSLSADLLDRTVRYALRRHHLEQERALMIERLSELSVTDELTSLANRRYLMDKLDEEVRRSGRTQSPFGLLMVDLDRFKDVNDRYGHQVGDAVLTRCASILRHNVRSTDFVARYGGEEFCILLPDTPAQGALNVAEKLREAIGSLSDPVPTVSIGVAVWTPGDTPDGLLSRADKALYQAKEAGRDRVVLAAPQ
jgi:diguanylate cyclase (GGDEF)-like protein